MFILFLFRRRLHACDTKQVRFELRSSCVFSENVKSLVQILVHFLFIRSPFQKLEMKLATFRTKVIILSLSHEVNHGNPVNNHQPGPP
ncbi:hypothetical protein Peur_001534 [Populus x canadensis]